MSNGHLIGAETVQRAASSMNSAADDFGRHAGWLDENLQRFLQRFEELVSRMEAAMEPPPDCVDHEEPENEA